MKLEITPVTVWSSKLQDKPGALATKLEQLTDAGANLDFLLCRRTTAHAGQVYVAPLKGSKQIQAAKRAGFVQDADVCVLRVEGMDKPGVGSLITQSLADAGVNIAGMSTTSAGRHFIAYVAFDCKTESGAARRVLQGL